MLNEPPRQDRRPEAALVHWLLKLDDTLPSNSRRKAWGVTALTVVVISLLDLLTGSDVLALSLLLLPSLYATLKISLGAGQATILVSTLSSALLDQRLHRFSEYWLPMVANAAIRLGIGLLVCQLVYELRQAIKRETTFARSDALTGLANRRVFIERIEQIMAFSRRDGQPFTVAYIDLDRFKQVNDRFGHAEGDRLLCAVAASIGGHLRATDLAARLGGDEFAIIMPATARSAAGITLNRLLSALTAELDPHWQAGATIGALTFSQPPEDASHALQLADALMYAGKAAGRGCIMQDSWPPEPENPAPSPT